MPYFWDILFYMAEKKKKAKSMAEVSKGYEKFIEGKELNPKGKSAFENSLKAATKPHGLK